jgi:hypothetical protein
LFISNSLLPALGGYWVKPVALPAKRLAGASGHLSDNPTMQGKAECKTSNLSLIRGEFVSGLPEPDLLEQFLKILIFMKTVETAIDLQEHEFEGVLSSRAM